MLGRLALHEWSFSATAEWVVAVLLAFTLAVAGAFAVLS